jgi:hypothetical protein
LCAAVKVGRGEWKKYEESHGTSVCTDEPAMFDAASMAALAGWKRKNIVLFSSDNIRSLKGQKPDEHAANVVHTVQVTFPEEEMNDLILSMDDLDPERRLTVGQYLGSLNEDDREDAGSKLLRMYNFAHNSTGRYDAIKGLLLGDVFVGFMKDGRVIGMKKKSDHFDPLLHKGK